MLLKVLLSLGYFFTGCIVSSNPQFLPITAPKAKAVIDFQLGCQSSGLCTVRIADKIENEINVIEGETILLRFHAPYFMNTVNCNHKFTAVPELLKPMNPFKSGGQVFVRTPKLNEYVNSMEMTAEKYTNGSWTCDVLTNQIDREVAQYYGNINSNTYLRTICNFNVRFIVPEVTSSTMFGFSSSTVTTESTSRYTYTSEDSRFVPSSTSEKSYTVDDETEIERNNLSTTTEHTEEEVDYKNFTSTTERIEGPIHPKTNKSKKWIYITIAGLVAVIVALKVGLILYCRAKARKPKVRIISRRASYDNYDDDKKISFLNQSNAGQNKVGQVCQTKKNTKEGEHLYESLEDISLEPPKSKAEPKCDVSPASHKRLPKLGVIIHNRRVPTPDISNVQRTKAGRERLVQNDISKRPPLPPPAVSVDSNKFSIDSRASPFTRANQLIAKVQEKSGQKSDSPKPPKPPRNQTRPFPVRPAPRIPSEIPESEFEVYSEESEYNRDELIYTSDDEWDYEQLPKYNIYNS